MKALRILFLFAVVMLLTQCSVAEVQSDARPVEHNLWDRLLKKHVNDRGAVNYRGFIADSTALNEYLYLLSAHHPNREHWNENERLAYWINAYNAFTIQLIIRHYPVESIKDIAGSIPFINSPWDIKFIEIEGETYDLNNIEHGIIRKRFDEPRIHFALVCAALSCPVLRNEAYTAERLEDQLEDAATSFFNDPEKNCITTEKAELSKILSWYSGDFKNAAPSIREYVNRYSAVQISEKATINYMDYDWRLNEE